MDYKIQLLSFLASFIYGIFFCISNNLNKKLIKNEKIIFQYINTFLFIINITLLYIIIIYKINQGIFHIYFLITTLLGYIFTLFQINNIKKFVKLIKKNLKFKRKVL